MMTLRCDTLAAAEASNVAHLLAKPKSKLHITDYDGGSQAITQFVRILHCKVTF